MLDYQREFIQDCIKEKVLQFGSYSLKSGRSSPYFFNTGQFNTGRSLYSLGLAYANAIINHEVQFDAIFGPAYKGIPLGTAVSIALSQKHGLDTPISFDRKEEKDHGERGKLLGAPLKNRVLIVDDVISSGLSMKRAMSLIQNEGARAIGVCIALDRQERGGHRKSAAVEISEKYSIRVYSIIGLSDIIEYLSETAGFSKQLKAIEAYRMEYGA
jgi:orotate phosphoribosyltransferase